MKALLVSAAAIGLLSATPAFAQAGPKATANANASAEIVTPLSISKTSDLNFGRIAADSAASTVTVSYNNARTSTSPNVLIAQGSTPTAAAFAVEGQAGLNIIVGLDSGTVALSDGSNSMNATLTLYPGIPVTIDSTGNYAFKVGGALGVGANQPAGSYTGQFGVFVQYN